ncbi:MAG: hypothetical protein HYY36_06195 [Gammaproteobacteria bacterium]|nr:hypothetical protein [Gammaproteobacteria bacterium]
MGMFEKLLLGVVALLVLAWFWPGVRAAVERSRHAEKRDWAAVALPLAAVVLFVMLLIALAKG